MDTNISHPLGFCDCTVPPTKRQLWVRPKMQREVLGDMLLPAAHAWKEEEESVVLQVRDQNLRNKLKQAT